MSQILVFLDEKEEKIIEKYKGDRKLSKNDIIKEIIKEFEKIKNEKKE